MPKIMIVGDIHFRDKKLADIAEAWDRLVTYAHDKKFDLIACAGDVFDHVNVAGKEKTVGTIYNAFMAPFLKQKDKVRTVLIFGNHDIGDAMEKDALYPLEGCPWITVIRRPGLHDVLDGLSICALPWICREAVATRLATSKGLSKKEADEQAASGVSSLPDRLRAEIYEAKAKNFVLFLGHMEVTGAKRDNGMVQANGNFEFDPLTLASIGADAYALGHIHTRQPVTGLPNANDGYLGTLCQLSFGEEENWSGARVLQVDGGKLINDSWLENTKSPKYRTVETLEGLTVKPNDYVKLKAEEKPENLPEGVIFEKVTVNKEREAKANDLSVDTPIQDLLSAWKESSKSDVPIEKLCSGEEALRSELGAQGDAIGSLESIDAITLDNVTCHDHIRVDVPMGITALEGPNGSGKTTLVEALIVALYGKTPSRPSISSLVAQGKNEGRFEVEFRSGGKKYVVTREVKLSLKASSSKAFLREYGASEDIAGPKVEEVEKKCAALVGDVDMVMSGIFSSQGDGGSLIDAQRAERKELFAKLLGTHRLIAMSGLAKKRAQAEETASQSAADMAKRLKDGLATEKEDSDKLSGAKDEAVKVAGDIEKCKDSLGTAQEVLSLAESANRSRQTSIMEKRKLEEKRDDIASKARDLKSKKEKIGEVDLAGLEKKVGKARKAEMDLAKIEAEVEKYNALRESKMAEVGRIRADADRMSSARLLAHSEATSAAMSKAESSRKDRVSERKKLDDVRQDTAIKLEKVRGRLAEAKKKVELLSGFPDADICNSCAFAKDGLEHRAKIDDFERAIPRGEVILSKAEEQLKEFDEETERISAALGKAPALETWQADVMEKAKAIREDADKKEKDIPSVPEDMLERKKAAQDGCVGLKALEAELGKAKESKEEASRITSAIAEMKGKFDEVNRMIGDCVIQEPVDESSHRAMVKSLSDEIKEKSGKLNEANKSIGQWEAKADEHKKRKGELAEVEIKKSECDERLKVMSALAQAFGRDGIPQIIVDGALPRFQELMAVLLSEFGKGWDIQVRSQKATKAGTVQEAIDIMVDSGYGERDIGTYSGGEKKILKSIVRIAFATLQAERTGKGLKVLVLDEATDHMDDENAEITIRMLGRLKCFNQVIVISHHTRVLGEIVNKIRLGAR